MTDVHTFHSLKAPTRREQIPSRALRAVKVRQSALVLTSQDGHCLIWPLIRFNRGLPGPDRPDRVQR